MCRRSIAIGFSVVSWKWVLNQLKSGWKLFFWKIIAWNPGSLKFHIIYRSSKLTKGEIISASKFSSLKIFSNKFDLIFHDQTQANWTINHFHFTQSTKSVHRKKISWKIKKISVSKTTHSYLIRLINDFP